MRDLILSTLIELLSDPPASGGLGLKTVEERGAFEAKIKEARDGTIQIPHGWVPPFALIDPEPAETSRFSGQLSARRKVLVDGELAVRTWRQTERCEWTPAVLLCGVGRLATQALVDTFLARLPRQVTDFQTVADGENPLPFAATLRANRAGAVRVPGFKAEYEFNDVRIVCTYGRYKTNDRPLTPIGVQPSADEEE